MPRGERPLEPSDGVVVGFARDLRLLREKAGTPTYRELGVRAHYSAAALSEAASGRKLPSLPVTIAYVAACGGDTAEWEARWRVTAAELAAAKTPVAGEGDGERAPYVGLTAFQQEDADRFFGRDELVADMVRRLRNGRFLGVLGASGSGKSSLLRAGLVASLAAERERGRAPIVVFTPGRHPFEECAIHLAGFLMEAPGTLREEFSAEARNLHLRIRQAMAACAADSDVVLVVDQFEEIFTLCQDPLERASFIDALVTAASDPASRTRVVLGIRADFLGQCGEHPRLVTALRDAQVLVGAMTTDELRLAITGPAEQAGYRVETALVTRLVADATGQPGMLPLISHALLRTWLRRQGKVMTVAGYDAVGGIEHALARSAEEIYQAFDTHQQSAAKQIFLRLIALGEGTEDTKRRVRRDELNPDDPNVVVALDTLARERLITLGDNSVEIAHEALIRHWPRLREWLADDREGHRLHRQLTDATLEWERHHQDVGMLYRGARLAVWQDRPLDQLNDAERAFLTTSRHALEREHRVRRRRVWWTIGGLSTATAIVAVLAVIALVTATQAEHERALAVSRQLLADARAQLQADPELGLILAREAYTTVANEETEAVLRQAIVDSHVRFTLPRAKSWITGVAFSSDGRHLATTSGSDGAIMWGWDAKRHTWTMLRRTLEHGSTADDIGSVHSPVFSPDNRRIVMTNVEGVVSVWDWARRAKPVRFRSHRPGGCCTSSIALSSDGQRLASSGADGVIEIRHLDGNDLPDVLVGHDGPVSSLTFSLDGERLASSGEDGTVRIWNLVTRGSPIVLQGHEGSVTDVAFSPDGRHVTTTGADNTVRVWDAARAADSVVLGSHEDAGSAVAYSRDGRLIASVGANTVKIWNADHRAAPTVLRGHHGAIEDVVFSPDSRSVASASRDGTVKIWDVDAVDDVTVLRGHTGTVLSVAVTSDGQRVASGGRDGTVRIWDLSGEHAPIVLNEHHQPVTQLTFSHDGRHLATVDQIGTVFVWDTRDLRPVQLAVGASKKDVAFSPDGKRVAMLGFNSLSIWDTVGHHPLETLTGLHTSWPSFVSMKVAWSPNGHHLTASSEEDVVQLWDLRTGADPVLLPGHPDLSLTLAFSPDGTHLASGGVDGTVHLWSTTSSPTQPTVLHGHQGEVWDAAFSPDGRHLITSGNDDTVRIWKTDGTNENLVLSGFRATAHTVVPTTNDRYITAHDDGPIRLWRCPACGPITDVLGTADQHLTRELTPEERQTYLPATP